MEQAAPSPGFAGVRGQRGREKPRSSRSKGRRELGYQGRGRMVVTGLVCGGGGPDCPPPAPSPPPGTTPAHLPPLHSSPRRASGCRP